MEDLQQRERAALMKLDVAQLFEVSTPNQVAHASVAGEIRTRAGSLRRADRRAPVRVPDLRLPADVAVSDRTVRRRGGGHGAGRGDEAAVARALGLLPRGRRPVEAARNPDDRWRAGANRPAHLRPGGLDRRPRLPVGARPRRAARAPGRPPGHRRPRPAPVPVELPARSDRRRSARRDAGGALERDQADVGALRRGHSRRHPDPAGAHGAPPGDGRPGAPLVPRRRLPRPHLPHRRRRPQRPRQAQPAGARHRRRHQTRPLVHRPLQPPRPERRRLPRKNPTPRPRSPWPRCVR